MDQPIKDDRAFPDDAQRNGPRMTTERYLDAYRLMLLSRHYDEHCKRLLAAGEAVPHFHSGTGQEALMVASVLPLRKTDTMIYTHRGYGHLLAKGVTLREIALDMFMKLGGTTHGLGGVMHVNRPDLGILGREGAFGTRFAIAVGTALAAQLRGDDSVTVCFYGEAAGARGPLYESLNMAVLWRLPIVYIGENNCWSFSSRTEWLYPHGRMSRVWRGFDIPVHEFDGNDPELVYETVSRAVERARHGDGPSVLEGLTYRLDPHIWYDKADYQPSQEIAAWRERDPVDTARRQLLSRGVEQSQLSRIADAVEEDVVAAFEAVAVAPDATWADTLEVTER